MKQYSQSKTARRIKNLRKANGHDQYTLAAYLNITQAHYSRIENGINVITLEQLAALCRLYKVSADMLIFGE